jgi:hypothetical protein
MKPVGSVADVTYHTFWVRVDDSDAVQIQLLRTFSATDPSDKREKPAHSLPYAGTYCRCGWLMGLSSLLIRSLDFRA